MAGEWMTIRLGNVCFKIGSGLVRRERSPLSRRDGHRSEEG
jgi:hypothetical protein